MRFRILLTSFCLLEALSLAGAFSAAGAGSGAPDERCMTATAPLRASPASVRSSPFLRGLVDRVSPDSIRGFLSRLTGEEPVTFDWGTRTLLTRYSPTAGADNAKEMIAARLRAYGYDVAVQYYRIEQSLTGLRIGSSGTGLSVTSGGWIVRSADTQEWSRVRQGCDQNAQPLQGLDESGGVWVTAGDGGVIFTSVDDGMSWVGRWSGTTSRLRAVDLESGGTGWAAGDGGICLRTTNRGSSWLRQTTGQTAALYCVAALDADDGIAAGEQGLILRTSDAGQHWTVVPSGTTSILRAITFTGQAGWIVGDAGIILASTDGGFSWATQNSPITLNLNAVSFADASCGWAAGMNGRVARTTDGGSIWVTQPTPMPGANWTSADALSSTECWLGGTYGHILRTTDGGTSWEVRDGTLLAGWANVEATSPGLGHPSQEVLLTAHFDDTSEQPLVRAPGADDNGSGTGSVLEAARVLAWQHYDKTVRFVLFSGEEEGLYGSSAYVYQVMTQGRDLYAVVNLDCVGWSDQYLRILSNDASVWLGEATASVGAAYEPALPIHHIVCPSCSSSDHAPFWDQGYDAICGIEAWEPMPPQIHTAGDSLGLLNLPLLGRVAGLSVAAVATLAGIDTTLSGVTEPPAFPADLDGSAILFLGAPVPNPLCLGCARSGEALLQLSVRRGLSYQVGVFTPAGRLVRVLREGRAHGTIEEIGWDGLDAMSRPVSSGLYVLRLQAGASSAARRLVVIR